MLHRAGEQELLQALPLGCIDGPPPQVCDHPPQMIRAGLLPRPVAAEGADRDAQASDNRATTGGGAAVTSSGTNPSHGNVPS
jgi:hypothetical protein